MPITVTGFAGVRDQMQLIQERARNPGPFLEAEVPALTAEIDRAWSDERSPSGEAWPPYRSDSKGGSLRSAHAVTVGEQGLGVTVAHEAASYQFARRNPLPFQRSGGGYQRAGDFWDGHDERLSRFLSGEEQSP